MKTITIISHNRPHYLKDVLVSLARNDLRDWRVVVGQTPSPRAAECVAVVRSLLGEFDLQIEIHDKILDVREHPFQMLSIAFDVLHSDYNILIEDDTPVSSDITRIADQYVQTRRPGMCLCYAYIAPPVSLVDFFPTLGYASNLAFCATASSWRDYLKRWWRDVSHPECKKGYDYCLGYMSKLERVHSYQSRWSRTTHIGHLEGTHAIAEVSMRTFENILPPVDVPTNLVYRFHE